MFVVPDEFLESMICDFCHKFLSVGPVKVYPNRRIKCGRCSQDGDAGVVSQYGLVVEQGVFKCVNRFNGCKRLLSYDQVADHEVICRSKTYVCPVCPETTEISTFLLIKHFEERHKDSVLKTPSFRVGLSAPCTKTYLYRIKDNLFYIEFNNNYYDTISLKAIFVGYQTESENVTQTFEVYYGDDLVGHETETKKCADNFEGFTFMIPKIRNKFVLVIFRLDLSPDTASVTTVQEKKTVCFPRSVVLSADCDQKFSLNSCSTSVIVRESERDQSRFVMHCINCSKSVTFWRKVSFIEIKPNVYHFICGLCVIYYMKKLPTMQISPKEIFLSGLNKFIGFSCIWKAWGCSAFHSSTSEISSHEFECERQPFQLCPVPNCSYAGRIYDIREHSRAVNGDDVMILSPNYYLYFPNSTMNTLFHTKRYYLWAYHGFVHIEVLKENSFYKISLIRQDPEKNTDKAKPEVMIFENGEFVTFIADKNPSYTTKNSIRLHSWFSHVQ